MPCQGQSRKKMAVLKVLRGREAYDKLVSSIQKGAKLGLQECRSQFRNEKWNCTMAVKTKNKSTSKQNPAYVMSMVPHATREMAFAHGISAAGVTFALTMDCRLGAFEDCSCIHGKSEGNKGNWWGGCNENVKFGEVMARHFLEALQSGKDEHSLLNVHNNEVGRKAVRATLKRECRCHGISGSCSTRTCWRKLSSFAEVGQYLVEKYSTAKRVIFQNGNFYELTMLGTRPISKKDNNFIYSESSPDYCQRNMTVGSAGVLGRECEGSKDELVRCRQLCDSCRFDTQEFTEIKNTFCNCKFHWCCKVKCMTCKETTRKTRCVARQQAL
ncbi:predicted protein [Nematostella vectensis]|uniref:Protein Wnt n=1 Tax=Nematostella vectensis TaxID=45351 RepID=A7RSS8_NEMVE|nr:predicted protein [Nematostella vectensis]|eukprot:XP_001637576.1 predicted protein [Nematostella vectensis]